MGSLGRVASQKIFAIISAKLIQKTPKAETEAQKLSEQEKAF